MEDVERRSQSNSVEYDWLGPDLTRNTKGRYILIFLAVLISLTKYGMYQSKSRYRIIHLLRGGSYNLNMLRMFSASVLHTHVNHTEYHSRSYAFLSLASPKMSYIYLIPNHLL